MYKETTMPTSNPNLAPYHCPWWARWHHGRKRRADLAAMIPVLMAKVETARLTARTEITLEDLWTVTVHMDGWDHWHCPCGKRPKWAVDALARAYDRRNDGDAQMQAYEDLIRQLGVRE
jgi:hypothetical protein